MKKIFVTLVVLMMALTIVIPAAAGNGPGAGGGDCNGAGVGSETGAVVQTTDHNQVGHGGEMDNGYGSYTGNEFGTLIRNMFQNLLGFGSKMSQMGSHGTYTLVGTITAIGTDSITVDVFSGNKLAQSEIGDTLVITVNSQTWYVQTDGTTHTLIDFTDLEVGQYVSVNGNLDNDTWLASRITVGASIDCLQ